CSWERGLIHLHGMRPNGLVAPAAELDTEAVADRLAQPLRNRTGFGIVIDVCVVAVGRAGIYKLFCHPDLLSRLGRRSAYRRLAMSPNRGRARAASTPCQSNGRT